MTQPDTMQARYAVGVDFGTESARAVLVRTVDGAEMATAVLAYPDGVIEGSLPGGSTPLGLDWALQNPLDYLTVLEYTVRTVVNDAAVPPEHVVGLGIDFTSCTVLPTLADGTPLCTLPEFAREPHAWTKLWKHHAAQPQADRMNAVARERGEPFLQWYGGKISSEWWHPKLLQTIEECPQVAAVMDRFVEATDWVVWQLTGVEKRSSCAVSYKALWDKRTGFPPDDYFDAVLPGFGAAARRALPEDRIVPVVSKAGELTAAWAERLGLPAGTAVAAGTVDSFVSCPAVQITGPNAMLIVMGTSNCHVLMAENRVAVPGMTGVAEDGVLPGYFGYEAGQAAVGDIFGWFERTSVPPSYAQEATTRGVSVFTTLQEAAAQLRPAENGLVALDWWNGNRSILADASLSGLIVGLTLSTRPEEIYRALIEATAFGTRTIIETFRDAGVRIDSLYACGGLPERNSLLMQIYADVTGMPIQVARSPQAPAVASSMFGAVAAGRRNGGFDSIAEAAQQMGGVRDTRYSPNPESKAVYDKLYGFYRHLHDYFGVQQGALMHELKALRERAPARETVTP